MKREPWRGEAPGRRNCRRTTDGKGLPGLRWAWEPGRQAGLRPTPWTWVSHGAAENSKGGLGLYRWTQDVGPAFPQRWLDISAEALGEGP